MAHIIKAILCWLAIFCVNSQAKIAESGESKESSECYNCSNELGKTKRTFIPEIDRMGCYRDKGKRQLNLAHWTFPANSPAVCAAACRQAGYKYAGPEAGNHCFCGNQEPPESIPDVNCNMICNGAKSSFCGGWWALEVFDTNLQDKQNLARVGCFRDKGVRQLGITHWVFSRNSPAVCIAACRQQGYKYAGPEATSWCFCGNLLPPEPIADTNCNMKCNGAEVTCGGWWALEVFETGI